jgi:GTP:adenosylcobinamide-phosphate guanylyltransferase
LQKRAVAGISCYYGKTSAEREVRVFQLINLLTMGTSFTDIIYTFGRYYLNDYGWAVDFNITIGADLQIIYKNMVDNVTRPASRAIL